MWYFCDNTNYRCELSVTTIKDCLHHLGKCTSRLPLTADEAEVVSLHRRLRLVCTVGDKRSMVELKVMTEVKKPLSHRHSSACLYYKPSIRLSLLSLS
jgi:hypothetical protein